MFKANSEQIDLILMDVVMPQLSGPEAYSQIAKLHPGAKVIFTTGYTSEAAALMTLLEKGAAILQKPFGMTALSQMVRSTLDRQVHAEKLQIS
jgi:DNA-binding NarL/FixJ family response regulator